VLDARLFPTMPLVVEEITDAEAAAIVAKSQLPLAAENDNVVKENAASLSSPVPAAAAASKAPVAVAAAGTCGTAAAVAAADAPRITPELLRKHCKDHKLYLTPELNDQLYLHYRGFVRIENLDAYTGLRALWLECNAISRIEGLDKLTGLRCLYLHQNCIERIEGLDSLQLLDSLNVSNNLIRSVENLAALPVLKTLNAANNRLINVDSILHLAQCPSLEVVDLANNQIDDPAVVEVFERMPHLAVLILKGNPVVRSIPNYRKTMIVRLQRLTYLDDRPVSDKERRLAEAWLQGGLEAEKQARKEWDDAEYEKMQRGFRALGELAERNRAAREAREALFVASNAHNRIPEDTNRLTNMNLPPAEVNSSVAENVPPALEEPSVTERAAFARSDDDLVEVSVSMPPGDTGYDDDKDGESVEMEPTMWISGGGGPGVVRAAWGEEAPASTGRPLIEEMD
jgi:hypothetical protein